MSSSETVRNTSSAAGSRPASPRAATSAGGRDVSRASTSRVDRPAHRPRAREQEAVKAWIRDHEELALIGAFAVGVFIGAIMRT